MHYADTSALVKLVVREPETEALLAWLSDEGVSAAAALAAVIAPEQTHDLDAAWWSIDADDPGSPYSGDAYRLNDGPGLSRAAARVGVGALQWATPRTERGRFWTTT